MNLDKFDKEICVNFVSLPTKLNRFMYGYAGKAQVVKQGLPLWQNFGPSIYPNRLAVRAAK